MRPVERFLDDLWGRELGMRLVRKARAAELDFIRLIGVCRLVDRRDLQPVGHAGRARPLGGRIAKCFKNKTKGSLVAELLAAMPPLMC